SRRWCRSSIRHTASTTPCSCGSPGRSSRGRCTPTRSRFSGPRTRRGRNPPLWGYLLAPVVAASNAAEGVVHVYTALWAAVAAWGMWRVAAAVDVPPLWVTALFVTTPCFFVLANTVMPDVPAAALALHGAAFVLAAYRAERP